MPEIANAAHKAEAIKFGLEAPRPGQEDYITKGPFVATQLNSTQLDVKLSSVEFSCVVGP